MSRLYHCTVHGFDIKLNELINGRTYNYRTRKYHNPVKTKGDNICCREIRRQLKGVRINNPVVVHYKFYVKDKRSDRDGIISAFWKCYLDALQKCDVIKNDGYNDVLTPVIELMEVDSKDPRVETIIEEIEIKKERKSHGN